MHTSPRPHEPTHWTPALGIRVELRADSRRPSPSPSRRPDDSPPPYMPPQDTTATRLVEAIAVLAVLALCAMVMLQLSSAALSLPILAP